MKTPKSILNDLPEISKIPQTIQSCLKLPKSPITIKDTAILLSNQKLNLASPKSNNSSSHEPKTSKIGSNQVKTAPKSPDDKIITEQGFSLKRGKSGKNSSHTIDPDFIKIKNDQDNENNGKTISYDQNDLQRLEVSIQKLKQSYKVNDTIQNSKALIQTKEQELEPSPIAKYNSDKYWAKKVSSLNTRNNMKNEAKNTVQHEKLDRLGGKAKKCTKINHKISDFTARAGFGIETYRVSRDSSFGNEELSKDDLKGINSSRSKCDSSFLFDKLELKQDSISKRLMLRKDKHSNSKPLY